MIHLPILADTILTVSQPCGEFHLKRGQYFRRFPGDNCDYVVMEMHHKGKHVATLSEGASYGWGNFHGSLSKCRGMASLGLSCWDQNQHDTPPRESLEEAAKLLAFRAAYILSAKAKAGAA